MWQSTLSQLSVEGWVINTNVHGFFYIPSDPLQLPVHTAEAFRAHWMPCSVIVVVYRGWGPKALLQSFSKGSARFSYIFFWAVDVWVLEPVYYPTFLVFVVFILEKGSDGVVAFEVYLDAQAIAGPLEFSPSCFV